MDEQRKILRIFQLISRLRSPIGCSKRAAAEDFEVSERTIERYFYLLRDLGFEIIKVHNRFKIAHVDRNYLKHEELIIFSLEEAATIRDAILSCSEDGPVRKSLLEKIYALTELNELSETVFNQNVTKNINNLRLAINSKKQVKLKRYRSAESENDKNYLIEPLRFYHYFKYLVAYDVNAKTVKQFKTERIAHAEITEKEWENEKSHIQLIVDPFGMKGPEEFAVKLRLSKRAKLLLEEEYPDATPGLTKTGLYYYWKGKVVSMQGIGRFVLGLIDEIEIMSPEELKQHITEKIKKTNIRQ